jgi:hypothetical protein
MAKLFIGYPFKPFYLFAKRHLFAWWLNHAAAINKAPTKAVPQCKPMIARNDMPLSPDQNCKAQEQNAKRV